MADAPECPACHLTYPRANDLLGMMPRVSPGISDSSGVLKTSEIAKIKQRVAQFQHRFNGLVLQIVVHRFPPEHPFSLHAFWMFNRGSFSGNANRGAHNRAIFLALDPSRRESAITVGYALEAVLSYPALDHLLELAEPLFQERRWADGIHRVLDGLDPLLTGIAVPEQKMDRGEEY